MLARDTRIMRFQANYVSTSVSGDYYQAMFEYEKDADDPLSPYLLIQRQFEMPDQGTCYVETHDEKYIGHFLLRPSAPSRVHAGEVVNRVRPSERQSY